MGKLLVNNKDIVVPGEVIAEGMDFLPGDHTRREGDKIVASLLGLVSVQNRLIKLIPLSGKYKPKRDDNVIGKVVEILPKGWMVDIGCQNRAMISLKDGSSDYIQRGADLTKYFKIGDYVLARISNVTSNNLIDLTMRDPRLKKLGPGRLVKINPTKVPRLIGKKASMITLIKDKTDCRIFVGQNGWIWVSGDPKAENLAIDAIKKIEKESHLSGLTEKIEAFIDNSLKSL